MRGHPVHLLADAGRSPRVDEVDPAGQSCDVSRVGGVVGPQRDNPGGCTLSRGPGEVRSEGGFARRLADDAEHGVPEPDQHRPDTSRQADGVTDDDPSAGAEAAGAQAATRVTAATRARAARKAANGPLWTARPAAGP